MLVPTRSRGGEAAAADVDVDADAHLDSSGCCLRPSWLASRGRLA